MKTNMNGVQREMTSAEQAAYEHAAAVLRAEIAAEETAAQQRANSAASGRAKLAALGLTDDEINALVGA